MDVVFRRTGARRYAVRVERKDSPTLEMNPAPGYDARLPHDLLHFVVEAELGLSLGIFGQLAVGGDAGSFHLAPSSSTARERSRHMRRIKKRGERLARDGHREAQLSERAVVIFENEWTGRDSARRVRRALSPSSQRVLAKCSERERELFSEETILRVFRRLDQVSARWSRLQVGGSMTLPWPGHGRSAA